MRSTVPTLPGSWTPSSATYRPGDRISGGVREGRRTVNITPWGVFIGLTEAITSSGTVAQRAPSTVTPVVLTTAVMGAWKARASASS